MARAFRKDVVREIKNTFGRFIAIFLMVFLGVAFFTGIGSTGIDMKMSGDLYFTENNLMDIRVVSTYGINDNDIAAMRAVEGVEAVYPSYNTDALVNNGDAQIIVKLHGLAAGPDTVNTPGLISGHMPAAENEAVAERGFVNALGLKIGDSFTLESGKKTDLRDSLKNVRFKLTGVITSVYYVSIAERGSSSIGSGAANYYLYIPESNFRRNVYSEAFVTVKGARDVQCFSDEYEDLVAEVSGRLEELGKTREKARYVEATDIAYRSLDSMEAELGVSKISAEGEFDSFGESISAARKSLEKAKRELLASQAEISGGVRELGFALDRIRGGIAALNDADEAALSKARELAAVSHELGEAVSDLNRAALGLEEKEALLHALLMDDPETLIGHINDLARARAEIAKNRDLLQKNREAAYAGERAANEARAAIAASRMKLEEDLNALLKQKAELSDGEIGLVRGYIGVYHGFGELDRQMRQLEERQDESRQLMEDSQVRLEAAKKALRDLDKPKWYVTDRDSNPGYSGFFGDADKVEAIGKVFPFIFFIVAALVSLTTMTRLVEERRIEIGTLKSLGYGDYKIMSKYLIYAGIPTILGGLAGGAFGMSFLPITIITAYQSLYTIPKAVMAIHAGYWAVGAAISVVCTLAATLASCAYELRAPPAILMRPKPPKRGARIFLERVPLFWRSLTFIWKVTIRNIVRYKKRFYMTIAGIAGCTALLMTGFGLRDSIDSLIRLQYGEVNLYDITVSFMDTAKKSDKEAALDLLGGSAIVRGVMPFRMKTYDAGAYKTGKGGDMGEISANLVVPADAASLNSYISLRERVSHKKLAVTETGVLITEKLAARLGAGPGDSIYIDRDGERLGFKIGGISENYYLHYIYMHEAMYTDLFGEKPEYNAMYVTLGEHGEEQKHELTNSLLEKKGVGAIFLTSTVFNAFNRVINSLNFVIFILIVSAAALAVVVLMNLTNINISERKRELATIEVLGFYDKEVSAYIYRENIVLTVIGAAAGLALGVALHSFVIRTAETDFMMFGRKIRPESFFYSAALTLAFAAIVNVFTGRQLRKIDMVEALKSVE